ncbi:MAG: hypothetical protein HOH95_08100 [Dehalococcoidia bacterium]|nr:hypothetical protein [Dehalococcoidia bacterium]
MTTQQSLQCHVCEDTADNEALISECLNCSRPFHLNPYNSGDHKDCGDAVIGPSSGIEFWCNPCLTSIEEAERAAGTNDPRAILDQLSGADQFLRPLRPDTSSTPAATQTIPDEPAPNEDTPAPPSGTPSTPSDSPPARRSRSTAPRRYRRIDGA